ncbi:hypothetical protein HPP92_022217 [Vanilla planifolia]|uniref:Uncharacterized protein n=1 Tax=Vanilla planifolia TaxID=51239 RepID=A0A835UDE1_VANPL|nr:hypothetical protein HPP92_022217 [Vanilla planifolia]
MDLEGKVLSTKIEEAIYVRDDRVVKKPWLRKRGAQLRQQVATSIDEGLGLVVAVVMAAASAFRKPYHLQTQKIILSQELVQLYCWFYDSLELILSFLMQL